jgi:hypothetical protein
VPVTGLIAAEGTDWSLRRHAQYSLCYGEGRDILGADPLVHGAWVLLGGCLAADCIEPADN